MKLSSCIVILSLGLASAFAPTACQHRRKSLPSAAFSSKEDSVTVDFIPASDANAAKAASTKMPMEAIDVDAEKVLRGPKPVVDDVILPGRYNDKNNSIAVPFLKRPDGLDGSHAGDYGFDPLGLAVKNDFYAMQESEIRHARLAMLAVVGWPLSEMVAPNWMLQQNGCVPSVLNGFNPLSFIAVAAIFGAIGFFEFKTSLRSTWDTPMGKQHEVDMAPIWKYGVAGDYNFDPLNLYSIIGDSAFARKGLRDAEIGHGRMAMLGITYFAAWEALTSDPIIDNSIFFSPNPVLPLLTVAYVAFSSIYEVKPGGKYLFEFEKTSEGEALLENLKLQFPVLDTKTD